MINLMPPPLKEQIHYARMNRVVVGYMRVILLVLVVLAGVFGYAVYLIRQQTSQISTDVANKESQLASIKKTLLPKAEDASERLAAIAYVQSTQTRFSKLVSDLASLMPIGVTIQNMTLTGDDQTPVTLVVSAGSYDEILALRDSLATSPRISGADIVNISGKGTVWSGNVVIAFKPGQAK